MAQMTGADAEDLERGASSLEAFGKQIAGMRNPLRRQLQTSPWQGRAADRFRQEWDARHGPALSDAGEFLRNAGRDLLAEAAQQRGASNGGGGGRGTSVTQVAAGALAMVARLGGLGVAGAWSDGIALRSWDEERSGALGAMKLSGAASAALLAVGGAAAASAGLGADGLFAKGSVEARAALIEANARGRASLGPIAAEAKGSALVGARAGLKGGAEAGPSGIRAQVEGDAFAGAEASVEGDVDFGVGDGEARAAAWAGIGAKGSAKASASMDEVRVGASLGVALGLGGSIGFEVSVSPRKMVDSMTRWF